MPDLGPSLEKLRRDWSTGTVEVPAGQGCAGNAVVRVSERGYRVVRMGGSE